MVSVPSTESVRLRQVRLMLNWQAMTSPDPLGFLFSSDFKRVVTRDYEELNALAAEGAPKSVLVLSGSVIEGVLSDALIDLGRYSVEQVNALSFEEIIKQAEKHAVLKKAVLSTVVREYRNLVHPAREVIDRVEFDVSDANLARSAVEVILRDVRAWADHWNVIKRFSEHEKHLLNLYMEDKPKDSEFEHPRISALVYFANEPLRLKCILHADGQAVQTDTGMRHLIRIAPSAKRYLEVLYYESPVVRSQITFDLSNIESGMGSGSGASGGSRFR